MTEEKITTTNLNLSPNTPIPVASIDTPTREFTTLPSDSVVAPTTPIIQPESEVKIQEDIKTITPKVDESYKNLLDAMGMTENQGARILEAEQQAGIPTLNKELTDIENEIREKSLRFRREREGITTTPGLTTAQASARLSDVTRKQNSELADLEVVRASRSNSLTNIQNAISRKFELQFADDDRRVKNLEIIHNNLKGSLTKAEDRQYDAMIKKEERVLDKEKEEAKRVYDLLETAAKNGATREVLLGISNAKTYKEALQIGARFTVDPLDREIKQAQLDKLNRELSTENVDAGQLVKINGQDFIRYKDGTISNPVLPGAGDIKIVTERLSDKITTINSLSKTENGKKPVGLIYSSGILRSPIGTPPGFKNEINDWRADIVSVVAKLTVDELGRVKSDGVTFGALSNGEREAVGQAATVLTSGMIYEGKGEDRKPTGKFKISENKVQEALDQINKYYLIDFERRAGIKYDDYSKDPTIIREKSVDNIINETGTAIINTQIYGNYPTN